MAQKKQPTINNKAIGLVRVSSTGQEHNQSTALQEDGHRRYCEAKGLELVEIVPLVETARRSDLRKEYHRARNRALQLGIGNLLFSRYDREARNLTDNEDNENLVRQGKIVLHYVFDNKALSKDSPDSDFFQRDIQAAMNKHYSRDLSSKIRNAMAAKAAQGWSPIARPPDGYINQKMKNDKGLDRRRGSIITEDPNSRTVKRVQREFEIRAEVLRRHSSR
jgi:DNA invertase Pin-like site-specific DNA recombinase